jgi:hypothetical protein
MNISTKHLDTWLDENRYLLDTIIEKELLIAVYDDIIDILKKKNIPTCYNNRETCSFKTNIEYCVKCKANKSDINNPI